MQAEILAAIDSAVSQSADAIRTFSDDLISAQHATGSPLGKSPLGRALSSALPDPATPPRQTLPSTSLSSGQASLCTCYFNSSYVLLK